MSTYQVPAAALPSGIQSALQVRPVQAGAYTANPFDLVPCDTTGGAWTATLPLMPANGTTVGFKLIAQTGTNAVTVTTSGTDVINKAGGGTTVTLSVLNQGVVLQYESGIWTITGDDLPLVQLDHRYQPVANIAAFGALTSASDNGPAINAAVASLPNGHGNVYIPPGTWHYTTQINLGGLSGVRFFGDAQRGNTTSTQLMYDGTGSSAAISATGSAAITFERLFIQYSSSSFTGYLIDFSGTGTDSAYETIRDCFLGSAAGAYAAAAVCLNHCNQSAIEDSHFQGAQVAILGQSATGSYANGIKIDGCSFSGNGTHIMNAAQAWMISNNVFEPCTGTAPGMYSYTPGYSYASGLTFTGNWAGDTTASSGVQINAYAQGLVISGNYIGQAAGETGIALTNSAGVNIHGNTITGGAKGIDFGSGGGNSAVRITGNTYSGSFSSAIIAGTVPADAVIELPGLGTGYGTIPNAAGIMQFPSSAISVGGVPITATLLGEITGTYGPNLLSNPDFSSTSSWSVTSPGGGMLAAGATFTSISTDSADGSGTCGNVVCTSAAAFEGISQTVTGLAASTTYVFQAYVKTTTGTNPQGVLASVYDSTNSIHFTDAAVLAGSDAQWTLLQNVFTTGSSGPVTVFAVIRDESAAVCTFRASDAFLGTYVAYVTNTSLAAETTRAETAEALKLAKASNLSDVASAATALSNLGGQGARTPTPVKTGAYTASAGDFVPCDTTSGAFTVTLPSAPANLSVVGVRHVAASQTGGVAVTCGGSDVLGKAGGPVTIQLPLAGNEIMLQYSSSLAVWYVLGDAMATAYATPQFEGYAAWTYDVAGGGVITQPPSSTTFAAGKYYLTRLPVSGAAQFQSLNGNLSLIWSGSGTGQANCFLGLYGGSGTAATLLGSLTANQSAASTGYLRLSIGSVTSLTAYPQYYVGLVIGTQSTGGTGVGPYFAQNSRSEVALNPGNSTSSVPSRCMISVSTGNTTLPSSITLTSSNVLGTYFYPWYAVD